MIDVSLSILALIASGLTLELFTGAGAWRAEEKAAHLGSDLAGLDEFQFENPS